MKYFKTKEAAEIAGVKRDRFVQWIFKGLITPAVESPGRGMAAQYDVDNILTARLIRAFYNVGFPLKKAATVATVLVKLKVKKETFDMEQLEHLKDGRLTMTVNIDAYRKDIEAEIKSRTHKIL